MKLHQVLTGATNTFDDKAAIAVGSVDDHPFTAYASGCDVVILLSGFTRVQIIPGSLYGYKEVSCIDCCDSDGKIAASYGKQVILFEARSAAAINNHGFPFHWENSAELCLNFRITCLSWNREGKRLLVGGDFIQLWSCEEYHAERNLLEDTVFWTCIWACKPSVPVHLLQFSPDGQYFCSVGKHDRLVKVWFDNNQVNPQYESDEMQCQTNSILDYTFVYLAHPGPVTGFSWRKTSKYMPVSAVVNCLLTSCTDNVCRIWCETIKQYDHSDPLSHSNLNRNKCLWHSTQPLQRGQTKEDTSTNPLMRYQLSSSLQFHVAAAVNALSDIPILSSLDSITSGSHSSFVLHWLNNKEIQFTMAAESCLGAPVLALEVQSVDVSDDSSIIDSEAELLVPSDEDILNSSESSPAVTRKREKHMPEKIKEVRTPPSPRARTPLDYLKHLQDDTLSDIEESSAYAVVVSSCIGNLLHEWYNSPDTLLAVHPIDGSLLVWLVEWLDVQNGVPYRQPQVSFLSRIPSVLPPADANSLLNKLMVYCPREDKVRALRNVMINKGDFISAGRRKEAKPSAMALNISRSSFGSLSGGTHPTAVMISTHRDGALNLWQLAFADNSSFSTIVSVSHHLRRCGHRYPITNILAHPELPLMLSTSSHEIEGRSDTDFFSPLDDVKGKPRKLHCNELIVWKVESVSPLRQSGGVLELTRVNSSRPNAFMNIAWVPTLFSHSLISFDSSASIPPHAVAPCACFLALDGTCYRFYQVILDARTLQGYISSNKSRTRSTLYSSGSEESLDSLDFESPSNSVPMECFIESIVSRQSGATPGCILKLCSLADSKDILKEPLLLHVFTENSVKSSSVFIHDKHSYEHDEDHQHSTGKSENSFYVVGVENIADSENAGDIVSMVYMWQVTVTATKPETNLKAPGLETITGYPEVVQPISRSSSGTSNRSVSPLNVPQSGHVTSSIVSRNVCSQRLPLPGGSTVVTATRAADKMSSSAVNPTCPAQYLFTTSCSDGKVRFWSCREIESENQFVWEETSWLSDGRKCSAVMQTTKGRVLGLDAPGEVLSLSCAYTGRIATLCRGKTATEKDTADLSVCIWENESSGGMDWVLEDSLKLDCSFTPDNSQIRLEWTSAEDGSHILTVCIGSEVFILGCASRIANTSVRGDSSTNGKEMWLLLHSIHLTSENKWQLLTRALSWIRNGVLVVGLGTEMQVYSQWRAVTDGTLSPSDTMTFAPTATLKKVSEASRGEEGKLVPLSTTPETGIGLFEGTAAISPVLPQFHPKHLMELMNFGKLRRVRAILHHLVYCVAGREAMEAASKAHDQSSHSRPRLSSMSSMKSIGSEPDLMGIEGDDKDKALSVPPLPLYALLAADKDTSGSGSATSADTADGTQGISTDETDYSALFETPRYSSSVESDDEDKVFERNRSKSSPTHVAQAGSPVHFGLAQARLLSYHLTKKPLPGLTSIEQLELQALADTFASAKLDLEESPGSIERGVKFAKKEDESYHSIGGLMGGPGGGGGGYATTGSIGATAGSGGDAVDECGLRFLLAMRHHTCLMRSLPPKHRAVLEEKGLSSSYYGWAFHSESEEELLAMVPPVLRGEAVWSELRKYGIGWWVRSNDTLRRLIEKTAKAQFSKKQEPIDCALFYLAMKKKNVICGLYRTVRDSKMSQFFARDFTQDRWRKAALKNAYSLLGKQRFDHAAAFFLLAGSLWDAIQVCIGRLHDFQLAMVLARLYEEDTSGGPLYTRILKECLLGQGSSVREPSPDPFLRSIAYWLMKDYNQALETLILEPTNQDSQEKKCNPLAASGNPDIFNFYLYLRKHPLIKRRRYMHEHDNKMKSGARNVQPRQRGNIREEEIIDEPLSPMERQLFFKTAHAHMNSGCPALALQVLMELPATDPGQQDTDRHLESEAPVEEASGVADDVTGDMINTGTLSDFSFGGTYTDTSINGTAEEFDWSKPVSSKLNGESSADFDWSQPASSKRGGNSFDDFDWSKPISSKLVGDFDWSQPLASDLGGGAADNFDWSKPVSTKLGGDGMENFSNGFDWGQPVSTKLGGPGLDGMNGLDHYESSVSSSSHDKDSSKDAEDALDDAKLDNRGGSALKSKETRHLDVVAQQMKFSAILKLLINELHGLPFSCVIADEDLRPFFLKWLEKELEVLHKMSDYGSVAEESDDEAEGAVEINIEPDEVQQEGSTADKNYIALKIDRSAKHMQWLKKNQKLLTILLNYCCLHGASGGDLAAMNMELLLLLHEVEQMHSLVSPLCVPSAGPSVPPLILASVSPYSFMASPLGFLQSLTQDILRFIFSLPGPPSPAHPVRLGNVLHNLTGTLSDCIYQSLTGMTQDNDAVSGNRVTQGKESSHAATNKGGNRSGGTTDSNKTANPTSAPSKWPGVRLLLSLLATEHKDNSTKLRILLGEACVAVYLSLLALAWSNSQPKQLYRLVVNSLKSGMWGMVFGGGLRSALRQSTGAVPDAKKKPRSSTSGNPESRGRGQTGEKYWQGARQRWNFKLLGQSLTETMTQWLTSDVKPVYVDQFIPPRTTLMEYFISKPPDAGGKHYDSDDDKSEDEDAFESDHESDQEYFSSARKRSAEPRDHLEHDSYSWSLMNYAISKLVLHNLQTFLPDVGFELTDLPSLSPQLHAAFKMVERWTQTFHDKLESSQGPPPDFISQFPVSQDGFPRGGRALMRYKALLDPQNTPFKSSRQSAEPVKRLWRTLVHQEPIQEIFIQNIFKKDIATSEEVDIVDAAVDTKPMKILYKDPEGINAFCINKANPNFVAVGSLKDVEEVDISCLFSPEPLMWTDDEGEREQNERSDEADFTQSGSISPQKATPGSQSHYSGKVLLRRTVHGVKRMDSHPHLPYYISGSQDGSVRMWEFGHDMEITSHHTSGSYQRVTRARFSPHGNKVGVSDASGQLLVWQVNSTSASDPFLTLKCHNKQTNDFAFVGSSSFIATAGHSSDGSNVCLWDTLVPAHSSLVHAFVCHENGAPCLAYVPGQQLLISGGRKGNICIFDLRQRQLRHTFLAHDAPVKSIVVDENEEFFISGSEDGDIKVWGLAVHEELECYPKEHGRGAYLLKYGTQGVAMMSLLPSGQLFSCGGDGTVKWRQLSVRETIVNSKLP